MMTSPVTSIACVLLLGFIPSVRSRHHDLRRELASVKEMVTGIERKLDSLSTTDTSKRIRSIEATLSSLLSKVADINRKSQLLSEIHQDSDARKDILQRISRSLEELGRRQTVTVGKKNDVESERLSKLSENIQALFQVFGGINRKIDDLKIRIERMPNVCPTSDLKFFITKKLDSLTASTALLSECLECDRESLKEALHSFMRHPLENLSKKCNPSDNERIFGRILESKSKEIIDSVQSQIQLKLDGFRTKLEEAARECNCINDKHSRFSAHDMAYSHDTPQEMRVAPKEDGNGQRETPGRIFRKLWRKMTEPINKVGEKIESLAQLIEVSNQRHHNETLTKIREWGGGKSKGGGECTKQIHSIFNQTKDTALRIGYIESRQLNMQNSVSKILSEVERVKSTIQVGNSAFVPVPVPVPGVTDAYVEGPIEGYLGTSCADLQSQGTVRSGIYSLKPKGATEPFMTYCDLETDGGGWTLLKKSKHSKNYADNQMKGRLKNPQKSIVECKELLKKSKHSKNYADNQMKGRLKNPQKSIVECKEVIQRRGNFGEEFRQNFTQNWEMYKKGFGDPQREFWIGNEKMHFLSSQEDVKLRVELEDFEGNFSFAEYSRFRVEDESKQFRLSVGDYRGNATDSLSLHDGKMFSTHDRDNDEVASCCNCADTFKGGWWYYRCFEANLNGPYHTDPTENGYFLGIIWERWRGDYSLKSSEMKVRPLSFENLQDP